MVEPYSLREARTGNILLYGWERGSTHIKAFNVDKIDQLRHGTIEAGTGKPLRAAGEKSADARSAAAAVFAWIDVRDGHDLDTLGTHP